MIRFLKIVEKHNLYFKQSKCDFNMKEITILGIVVGKGKDEGGEGVENTIKSQEH